LVRVLTAGLSFSAREAVEIDTPASLARSSSRVAPLVTIPPRQSKLLQILPQIFSDLC
jgi:hypothetical protein